MWSHYGSNKSAVWMVETEDKPSGVSKIGSGEYSPEKAGVGGSIPSLATISTLLKSALTCLFFRLCQICVVH
jgi:hypothetical protein